MVAGMRPSFTWVVVEVRQPQSPTLRPWRRTSDKVNVALATATLISAVDTNPTPPPNAVPADTACHKREAHPRKGISIPWIRAIVGIGSLLSLDSMFPSSTLNTQHTQPSHHPHHQHRGQHATAWRTRTASARFWSRVYWAVRFIHVRSAPALNTLPVDLMKTPRTPAKTAALALGSRNARRMPMQQRALSFSQIVPDLREPLDEGIVEGVELVRADHGDISEAVVVNGELDAACIAHNCRRQPAATNSHRPAAECHYPGHRWTQHRHDHSRRSTGEEHGNTRAEQRENRGERVRISDLQWQIQGLR